MQIDFVIDSWAAYAPGMTAAGQWKNWATKPCLPRMETAPAPAPVADMPALLRRRLGPLGRMAAQVAFECLHSKPEMPVIFSSRYGDIVRSLDLLCDYSRGEPVSAADFALSVHNSIGAVISIARKDVGHYSSVAGGDASAAAGVVEAVGLLDDGAPQVMLVHYDTGLPGDHAAFTDEPLAGADTGYAWAWCLRSPPPTGARLSLQLSGPESGRRAALSPQLPFGLDALRFALSDDQSLERSSNSRRWTWRRHG